MTEQLAAKERQLSKIASIAGDRAAAIQTLTNEKQALVKERKAQQQAIGKLESRVNELLHAAAKKSSPVDDTVYHNLQEKLAGTVH